MKKKFHKDTFDCVDIPFKGSHPKAGRASGGAGRYESKAGRDSLKCLR
ncbi:MAG: hypothetical protein LBB90_08575 [Tannerella sp.]|nr:hypothetical protein [Tannerella sp.]